jgi:hypothetical protein
MTNGEGARKLVFCSPALYYYFTLWQRGKLRLLLVCLLTKINATFLDSSDISTIYKELDRLRRLRRLGMHEKYTLRLHARTKVGQL